MSPEEFSLVFTELTKRLGLLFAGDKIVIPEEFKKQEADALNFGHPGSTEMLAQSKFSGGPGSKKS